jgi:Rrf2 family protein
MISITSEYALRALVVLAASGMGATMQTRELAAEANVPPSYLSKILATLRRTGLLGGSRGIRGGYSLARAPHEIRLIDVVELFEVVRPKDACLLGRSEGCDDDSPCSAHDEWKNVRQVYEEFLISRTIADLAQCGPTGQEI